MITSLTDVTTCIDWLSVTRANNKYPENYPTNKQELKRGMLGYDTAIKYIDGRVELCSSTRKDMGVHTIFSGDTLRNLMWMANVDSFQVLTDMASKRVSRVDVALDIKWGTLDILALWSMLESDQVDTRIEKWLYLRGAKGDGETLYIGAPKSDKRMRIYDKQAESGSDYEWTRVEVQYRHKMATRACRALLSSKTPSEQVPGMIVDFINFDNDRDWVTVMGSEMVKMAKPEITVTNREKWLLETAASALASEMIEGQSGSSIMQRFIQATNLFYDRKQQKYKP
jgi:hypothetical protein